MKNRILITGSDGFTGKYICKLFKKNGYNVFGLVQRPTTNKNDYVCDLTNEEAVSKALLAIKPNGIIHLAAVSHVVGDPKSFYDVNLIGTLNLIQAVIHNNLTLDKIIIASSANVYGEQDSDNLSETDSVSALSHYANSKLAMENMASIYGDRIPLVITRPFNYTGVGQSKNFLIPKIIEHFKENESEIRLGNIDIARDFSDVRDVARAYLDLYLKDDVRGVFNISSGTTISLKEILDYMVDISNQTINVTINPDFVRENEIKNLGGSNKKISQIINYKPQYSIRETLMWMYQS